MTILDEVSIVAGPSYDPDAWYFSVPAIAHLRERPLRLGAGTVIVGENGSGKSTLLEAIAYAWQRTALTGAQAKHWSPPAATEDGDLHWQLGPSGERPRPTSTHEPPSEGCSCSTSRKPRCPSRPACGCSACWTC